MSDTISRGDFVTLNEEGYVTKCNKEHSLCIGMVGSVNEEDKTVDVVSGHFLGDSDRWSSTGPVNRFAIPEDPKPKQKRNRFEMLEF